jgi:RNA polymerase subunit RPABC4/transcription elongation factor Spt4
MSLTDIIATLRPILTFVGVMLGAYYLLLWAAAVLWTYRDITSRSRDVVVQVLAVALVLVFSFPGLLLHLILRPRQTLDEKYEQALEEEYLRRDVEERSVCPSCQRAIEDEFILCPHCRTNLRRRCNSCDRVVDLTWAVCPYCGDDGTLNVQVVRPTYGRQGQPISQPIGEIEVYDR